MSDLILPNPEKSLHWGEITNNFAYRLCLRFIRKTSCRLPYSQCI